MKTSIARKNINPELFYFIGMNNNWEFSRRTLTALVFLLIGLFLGLIGIIIYQYLHYDSIFIQAQEQYKAQQLQTSNLQENLRKLKRQYLILKQEIDKKDFIISMSQDSSTERPKGQLFWRNNEKKTLQEISNLQNSVNTKEDAIQNLKSQNRASVQQIQTMLQKIADLKRKIREQAEKAAATPVKSDLELEQFNATYESNQISVHFNLTSLGNRSQAGYIMILPVHQEQPNQKIELDIEKAESFSIRRFRKFSAEFPKDTQQPFTAVQVTVWDRNRQKLLDQSFPLE
ncbi:MAG: hypothetical protein HQM14_13440 [SAR324 cluster bacterium]|nr:hypothetical protein [SAR324 cluster bacterium]